MLCSFKNSAPLSDDAVNPMPGFLYFDTWPVPPRKIRPAQLKGCFLESSAFIFPMEDKNGNKY